MKGIWFSLHLTRDLLEGQQLREERMNPRNKAKYNAKRKYGEITCENYLKEVDASDRPSGSAPASRSGAAVGTRVATVTKSKRGGPRGSRGRAAVARVHSAAAQPPRTISSGAAAPLAFPLRTRVKIPIVRSPTASNPAPKMNVAPPNVGSVPIPLDPIMRPNLSSQIVLALHNPQGHQV
ncbi:hypothetical protein PIB30_093989 [Stylosanthes scabra]|uniref:Uncharacterized protein n=1 Tax=Stylosanthes scabra TaxID=79078 RepID=A0ABU6SXR8_9FABA|nr:hypothetical protein [Stylosanthes scabra]